MRLLLFAYCLGVMAGTLVQDPAAILKLASAGGCLLLIATLLIRHPSAKQLLMRHLLLAVLVGFCWHLLWASAGLAKQLPANLEGVDMQVTGVVLTMPAPTATAQQIEFYIQDSSQAFKKRRVLLNVYDDFIIEPGQFWQFRVRLNKPHGFANPGGFDYEAWMFQRGISAKGYVRSDPENRLLGTTEFSIERFRHALRENLLLNNERFDHLGVVLAIGLGDRGQLQQDSWRLFNDTGTTHLFIVSGIHIGLITAVGYWLMSCLLRLYPAIVLYQPRQKLAALAALLLALLYSLMAGFGLPVQRAFAMAAVFVLSQVCNRPVPVSLRFLLAMGLVLSLNPLATAAAGFWLSFAAVAALLFGLNSHRQQHTVEVGITRRLAASWLRPQLVVFLSLLPLLLYWTQQQSLLAPLVNLLAIPVVGFVLVPMCLLLLLLLPVNQTMAQFAMHLSDRLIGVILGSMDWVASFTREWALVHAFGMGITQLLFLMGAVLLLLAPLQRRLQLLSVPMLLPMLIPAQQQAVDDKMLVHVLDVGQGLAIILQSRNRALVYDTGANLGAEFNLGDAVVVPVLRRLGIRHLDAVVVSHFDNDHAGGLPAVLGSIPTHMLYSNNTEQAARRVQAGVQIQKPLLMPCLAGMEWQWDELRLRFLHPRNTLASGNDGSCVLQIHYGQQVVLLPGDIEQASERLLARRFGKSLRSDILVAPHHGSNTSSTYAFIKQVAPSHVIFASGYRNSFGHPTQRISQRYQQLGAAAYTTHATGMLSFALDSRGPVPMPVRYRERFPRYWR